MKFLPERIDKNNIMLNDIIYVGPNKENKTDCLYIIYKDLKSGEKKLETIEKPEIEIYFVKEEYRNFTTNRTFFELDKCDKHTCEYNSLPWYIAKQAGQDYVNELKKLVEVGRYRDIRRIQTYPYVMASDIPIDVFYRTNWLMEYDNEANKPITKIFLDIESDTIDFDGFAKDGECPINAVTIIDDITNNVYTFLLNNPDNPQIAEFISDIDGFIDELHQMFDDSYGVLEYNVYMFDDERDLLKSMFGLINTLKRDMCLIWNGFGYDIPYILARAKVLGIEPETLFCHTDFKYPICRFVKDDKNFAIANKADLLITSSYTKYIDQMKLYAATRKGQSELRSNSLNNIGYAELKDEKIDYNDEANIKTFPYVNYRKFVAYNIKDVLLQMGIERKVNDCENLYIRSYSNCVDYDKVFKQTVMLKARCYYEYLLQGLALGNNINVFGNDASSFSGALVGNPLLNSHTGINLFGSESMYVYDDVIDMDFSSMYPHIITAFNIERHTMYGKLSIEGFNDERYDHLFIDDEITDIDDIEDGLEEGEDIDATYDSGKDFIDNYLVHDTLSLGTKWFNLPNFEEVNNEFKKKFKIKPKKRINIKNFIKYFIGDVIDEG